MSRSSFGLPAAGFMKHSKPIIPAYQTNHRRGCKCTRPRVRINFWHEFGVSCKCTPKSESASPRRGVITFLFGGGGCGVEFREFRGFFVNIEKEDD